MNSRISTRYFIPAIAAILLVGFSAPAFADDGDALHDTGVPSAAPSEFGTPDGTWYIQEWDGQVPWFEHPFPGVLPTLTPPFQFD
ncbi:MAG: hypothetical protein GTO02_04080, partial [Candidatus Dadabacteria bacterium]|nr:hypothetical protein [Candidatus Dadabacteria bacterium]